MHSVSSNFFIGKCDRVIIALKDGLPLMQGQLYESPKVFCWKMAHFADWISIGCPHYCFL
jgi:hypothetical protein